MTDERPVRVWLPESDSAAAMGGLPAGVRAQVWDGGADLPPGADTVQFVVLPFLHAGPGLDRLATLPALRVVQLLTAGAESVSPYVPAGVALCTARGAHDASTAEWVLAVILAQTRRLPRFLDAQLAGRWERGGTPALAGRTVLIVGYGSIGAAVERRLSGFEVAVRRVARRPREGVEPVARLPELLGETDVVVLLVPLTADTRRMVDSRFLSSMREGALLVNAARGPVVDTDALVAALGAGRIRAALDVTDPEPLPAGHPLWRAPGVLITPHVAGSTPLARPRAYAIARAQLDRYLAGEPLQNVVSERGY